MRMIMFMCYVVCLWYSFFCFLCYASVDVVVYASSSACCEVSLSLYVWFGSFHLPVGHVLCWRGVWCCVVRLRVVWFAFVFNMCVSFVVCRLVFLYVCVLVCAVRVLYV